MIGNSRDLSGNFVGNGRFYTNGEREAILGSARVSRAWRRPLAFANFSYQPQSPASNEFQGKVRFGATPKPTRETRALPIRRRPLAVFADVLSIIGAD